MILQLAFLSLFCGHELEQSEKLNKIIRPTLEIVLFDKEGSLNRSGSAVSVRDLSGKYLKYKDYKYVYVLFTADHIFTLEPYTSFIIKLFKYSNRGSLLKIIPIKSNGNFKFDHYSYINDSYIIVLHSKTPIPFTYVDLIKFNDIVDVRVGSKMFSCGYLIDCHLLYPGYITGIYKLFNWGKQLTLHVVSCSLIAGFSGGGSYLEDGRLFGINSGANRNYPKGMIVPIEIFYSKIRDLPFAEHFRDILE